MDEKIITNNQVVDIKLVKSNDYNPKVNFRQDDANMREFQKIKDSLERGQVSPVIVREVEGDIPYEIINGYHRWEAMMELGYTKIEIKNLGKIDFDTALSWALQTEDTKVPLDGIELATLLKNVVTTDKPTEYWAELLPYTPEVIQNKIDLIDFDWNKYENENEEEGDKDTNKFFFKVSPEDAELCHKALSATEKENDEAFVEICKKYLTGSE